MADDTDGSGRRPAVQSMIVTADGGSRGNPGPAGYGATVIDAAGTVLAERAAGIGNTTNNVAEYSGLIAGLQAATELGASTVDVRLDSKLVVEQLSGRWKVKHPDLRPLAAKAAALMAGFDQVSFTWVPRKQNSHADRLANEAMNAQAEGRQWEPPAELTSALPAGVTSALPSDLSPDPENSARPDMVTEPQVVDEPEVAAESEVATRPGTAAGPAAVGRSRSTEPAADSRHVDPAAGPPSVQSLPPGARPGSTTLLVVRHGQTTWGAENRFAGREDVPLSEDGVAEAEAVAARLSLLNVQAVVTSPLQRCRKTAEIIAAATGVTSGAVTDNDDLLDGTLGEWTGSTAAEIAEKWPSEFEAWRSDPDAAPPGGESFSMIRDRVRAAVRQTLEAHRGDTVVLVTHAAAAKMLVVAALGVPSAIAYRTRIDNCSISMITVDVDGGTMVCSVNDTGHLA